MKFETPQPASQDVKPIVETPPEQMRGNAIRAEEVRRRTIEIEWFLENGFEPTISSKDAPVKKGRTGVRKWLRGALAAGMLIGGVGTKADEPALSPEKAPVPVRAVGVAEKEQATSVETDRKAFIEKTGYDLETIALRSGFKVRLDVDNGSGPYILHIGQTHIQEQVAKVQSVEEQYEAKKQAISSQKKVEKALLALSQTNSPLRIFEESILEDAPEQAEYIKYRNDLSKITPHGGCFLEVLGSYKTMEESWKGDAAVPKIALTYLHRQKLRELEVSLQEYLIAHPKEYSVTKSVIETMPQRETPKKVLTPDEELARDLQESKEAMDNLTKGFANAMAGLHKSLSERKIPKHPEFHSAQQELEFVQKAITNRFDSFGEDQVYLAGAPHKLAVEGKAEIVGTENKATNDAAYQALEKTIEITNRLQDPRERQKLTEAEQQEAINEMVKLHTEWERASTHDRENIALSLIGKGNMGLDQRLIPFVYGSAHEFKRAVLEYEGKKFGLITFVPNQLEK